MTTDQETSPTGPGLEVPLAHLGRELKKLWQSSDALTKASLANFAIYSEDPASLLENSAVIREVTREHACRALLIAADPSSPTVSVRSWITAHCQLNAAGKKSICSEQIAFLISGQSPNLVPNTVFSWLESDLPLTFWWQGEFSARWEPHLYAVIDRLVIDSGAWAHPLPQLDLLEQAWQDDHGGFTVNDLSWTRVLHPRMALAAAFDEPGMLEHLAEIETIEIDYGAGHRIAAAMMAAWMIHQAAWTLELGTEPGSTFSILQNGRKMRLTFTATKSQRAIPRILLTSPRGKLQLTHESGQPFIQTRIVSPSGTTHRLTPCPCETPAELVTERLRRGCHTKRYFALLRLVRPLLGDSKA